MLNVGFDERLNAALAMVDKKSSRQEVIDAFQAASRVLAEYNFDLDSRVASGDVHTELTTDPRELYVGKTRLAKWLRDIAEDFGDIVEARVFVTTDTPIRVTVESSFPQTLDFSSMLFTWLTNHVNRLTKQHLSGFSFKRGEGKSEGTKYRNELVTALMSIGTETVAEVSNSLQVRHNRLGLSAALGSAEEVQPVNPERSPTVQVSYDPELDSQETPW